MTPFCLVLCWLLLVCPLSSDRCTLTNIQSLSFSMLSSPSFGQPILLRDSLVTSTVITLNPSKTLFLYNLFLYLCQLPALRFYFFPVFHWNATSPKINLSYRKKKKKKKGLPPSSYPFSLKHYSYLPSATYLYFWLVFNWNSMSKTSSNNVLLWNVSWIYFLLLLYAWSRFSFMSILLLMILVSFCWD